MGVSVDLTDRRILVTGASSGIGAAVCRSIVGCGGAVAMLARREARLDALKDELGELAVPLAADVTDFALLEGVTAEAARRMGGLDGVIAVAGKSMVGTIATGTPDRWRELFDLNLVGPLATVRYALDHFPDQGRRDVVLVGSAGGLTPMPGVGIYGASKRGLQAAFDSLRYELAPRGINASLVMPGMFETEGLSLEGVVIDGDVPTAEWPMFADDFAPGDPNVVADTIAFMIGLPDGVCINEVVTRPTGQFNP